MMIGSTRKKDRSRLCSMAVTVEMHNTGDPVLRAEVVSVIEHVLSDRPGDWRVSTSQPCEYGSVSTRKDWGMMVPAIIMIGPAFMVPDNRVSPCVEDPAVNEKNASKRKSLVLRRGFRSLRANLIRR
jgi:hypothetical protein